MWDTNAVVHNGVIIGSNCSLNVRLTLIKIDRRDLIQPVEAFSAVVGGAASYKNAMDDPSVLRCLRFSVSLGSKKCDIMEASFKNVIGSSHERMVHFDRSGEIDEEKDILKTLGLEPYQPKKEQTPQGGPNKQQPKPVAASAALAMDVKSDLLDELPKPASGLKWKVISAPTAPAQGRELKNSKLAAALLQRS